MRERRSPTPAAVEKRTAIRRLQEAMEEQRLCLHYQPIVDTRTSRTERVEALIREQTDSRTLNALGGEPIVNVLELNLALDALVEQ